jgi:hypothetical protein
MFTRAGWVRQARHRGVPASLAGYGMGTRTFEVFRLAASVVERDIGKELFWGLSPLERMLVIYAKMDHIDMAMDGSDSEAISESGRND